jgi:hypothetical protein
MYSTILTNWPDWANNSTVCLILAGDSPLALVDPRFLLAETPPKYKEHTRNNVFKSISTPQYLLPWQKRYELYVLIPFFVLCEINNNNTTEKNKK